MERVRGERGSIAGLARQYADSSNLGARMSLHERFGACRVRWHRWAFEQLGIKPGDSVLEAGCGPGALWSENLDRLPEASLLLTDLSAGMVSEARTNLGGVAPARFDFAVADVAHLPAGNATFDVVVANHMLYHVPDLDGALSELRRVLKPSGRLIAATNGEGGMREVRELVGRHLQVTGRGSITGDFSLESGRAALSRHFSQVRTVRPPQDPILVTEVRPLIEYIRSMGAHIEGSAEGWEALEREVAGTIAVKGRFHITRETGAFACTPA